MKTKIDSKILLIFAVLFGTFFSCKQKPIDKSVVRDSRYKESLIEVYKNLGIFCRLNSIPGLAVAVSIDNKLVLADGLGYSNVELQARVSPTHLFRIGQVSQIITAMTAAKLAEEGKLSMQKPVSEAFPSLNLKSPSFTLYQLGAHSAGVVPEKPANSEIKIRTIDDLAQQMLAQPLAYEPGSVYFTTDSNFDLLGYFIQKATGKDFVAAVKENLTDKLDLPGTKADNPYAIIEKRSSQYDYSMLGAPGVAELNDLRVNEASVGYLSSVLDMVKIGNALLYPGYLKSETIQMMVNPFELKSGQKLNFGFGVFVNKNARKQVFFGQEGRTMGGSAALLVIPEDKMVVAIAANIANSLWELPVFDVAETFQKQLHPEWNSQESSKPDNK